MLKRSGAILLTTLYLVTSMGFALNLHFCGNYLASVKIDAPAKSCRPGCAEKMKCCKNKHIDIKVRDTHRATSQLFLFKILAFQLPKLIYPNYSMANIGEVPAKLFDREPPDQLTGRLPAFLVNRTFRI